MIKIFCDSCNKETSPEHAKTVNIPRHIAEPQSRGNGYVFRDGDDLVESSLRMVSFQLCGKCANRVYEAMYSEICCDHGQAVEPPKSKRTK